MANITIEQICPQCNQSRRIRKCHTTRPGFTGLCFECSRGAGLTTHGEARTKPYYIWMNIRQRCCNPARGDYPRYGGRGIVVCDRWLNSYENFRDDMGRPPDDMSIERINNDGPYSPENCRWATRQQQANNKRNNRPITFRGRTQNVGQWAAELGLCRATLINRLFYYGWSVERALTTPVRGH